MLGQAKASFHTVWVVFGTLLKVRCADVAVRRNEGIRKAKEQSVKFGLLAAYGQGRRVQDFITQFDISVILIMSG